MLENVIGKIKSFTNSINITENANLTYTERKGLLWCIEMKNSYVIHFSQADKYGATVLMDPTVVIILSELRNAEKYLHLPGDPRNTIERSLLQICQDGLHHNGLKESELFLITGHLENGKSHNPAFKAGKLHPFPLFKLHSLTPDIWVYVYTAVQCKKSLSDIFSIFMFFSICNVYVIGVHG